jgi:hypothetical protein
MTGIDDELRLLLTQTSAEKAVLDRIGHAEDAEPGAPDPAPATPPAVSLMITNGQRAALRELGFSEEAIRQMTPSEAHGKLGLVYSDQTKQR